MKSLHWNPYVALVLILFFSLLELGSGQWQVIGPENRVKAFVGQDTVFSCSLSPETNAEFMEVRFFKQRFSAIVHLYQHGKDQENKQMPDYQRRTELVKDGIVNGQVLLRLKKVIPSDAGLYGCWFSSQTYEDEATWELEVSDMEMTLTPLISVMRYVDGGIQLHCQSSGWLSQPIVRWKGSEGNDLPSDSKVIRNMHGLFDVETFLTVRKNSGSISCSIQLSDKSLEVKARIFIGELFFQQSPWLFVSIALIIICCAVFCILLWMRISFSRSREKLQKELKELRELKQHLEPVSEW
ncbi:butyrophilin-like protein 3 [Oryctolagus cuniculus]|uniref:butyrophilin-like protein 3 n=1 Tax=Oryctolagus cuniculus TaxID=9986 RepID=UPI00387944BD